MGLRLTLASVAFLVLVITVVQNTQTITVRFLFWEFSISQILLITLIGVAGFLIGYFVGKLNRSPQKPNPPSRSAKELR